MARHRKDFFLATKTGSRTAREAREDVQRSLERLRVDHLDLIQMHSLAHPDDCVAQPVGLAHIQRAIHARFHPAGHAVGGAVRLGHRLTGGTRPGAHPARVMPTASRCP